MEKFNLKLLTHGSRCAMINISWYASRGSTARSGVWRRNKNKQRI